MDTFSGFVPLVLSLITCRILLWKFYVLKIRIFIVFLLNISLVVSFWIEFCFYVKTRLYCLLLVESPLRHCYSIGLFKNKFKKCSTLLDHHICSFYWNTLSDILIMLTPKIIVDPMLTYSRMTLQNNCLSSKCWSLFV